MVNIVASRAAGLRLSAIVSVLIIPILLLCYLMFSGLREDIDVTERESIGARLTKVVMSAAIGLAEGSLTAANAHAALLAGETDALTLGLSQPFMELNGRIALEHASVGEKLNHINRFISLVGTESALILDPVAETFYLAQTNTQNLPELLMGFYSLHSTLNDAISSNGIDASEIKLLVFRLGTLSHSIERTRDSVARAQASSDIVTIYDSSIELVNEIGSDVSVTLDVVANSNAGEEWMALTMLAQQTLNPTKKYLLERDMMNQTLTRLSLLLEQRSQILRTEFMWLLGVSALCVLLGAGAAIWMFHSTLSRLDHVENAKLEADAARYEAEQMNARISVVNEEVTTLNRELADKMLRLGEAQEELVKRGRLEQLGQLTATVAHEIRNPLGAVRTSTFLLERKIKGKGLGVEVQIERINKGVTRCDNIITQLLDFSRTKQLTSRSENLDNWLAETVEEEAARLPEIVSVTCTLGLENIEVPFDPARLRRAVVNLMANASEAMVGAGDDPTRIVTANPHIDISSHRDGEHVVIVIADNGPGISPDNLSKIREPLFTTKSFGTGLGVPAVEKILEQHGGRLIVASEFGKGARFKLVLPATVQIDQEIQSAVA